MNWLSVTLTVALTATTWLGWSDHPPATTVETALINPSESIDLPPVVRAAQAADDPPVEYDDLIITTKQLGPCAEGCEGDYAYPPPPVFTRIVHTIEMHATANPRYYRYEGMERLYARVGDPVGYEVFGGQDLVFERPNLPLGVPHWEQWSPLRLAAGSSIAWAGVPQGVTVEANGLRHIFTVPGAYTLTATVNAKFDLSMVVRPFCQICWWGRREVVADYKGLAAPPLQKTLGVTAVGVGSLTVAGPTHPIDDKITEAGIDRKAYLAERTPAPGTLVAVATPTPEVDDDILAGLYWNFTGGTIVEGYPASRTRVIPTETAAIHDLFVDFGATSKKVRQYIVGLDMSPSPAAPPEVLIGSRATPSASLVPAGARFLLDLAPKTPTPVWELPDRYVKNYITYANPSDRPAGYIEDALGKVIEMTSEDKEGDSINFHWVDSGEKIVRATLSIAGVTIQGQTKYTILEPILGAMLPAPPIVVDRNSLTTNPIAFGYRFEFGVPLTWPNTSKGVQLVGATDWIQTVKDFEYCIDETGARIDFDTKEMVLDNVVPYNLPSLNPSLTGSISLFDEPMARGPASDLQYYRDFSAESFLMVRPTGGIWVPAGRKVSWGFIVAGSNTPTPRPGGGTPINNWSLDPDATCSFPPTEASSPDFPVWSANWTEF